MIGETPLLRLGGLGQPVATEGVYLKLELTNPGGSVKDRTALALVSYGESEGLLRPGGVIVEPTSGNTGLGLALIAAQRGYRCVFTVTDKVSAEKVALLEAYGAEVVVCPASVPPEDPSSYYSVAREIARRTPGSYLPEQYSNPANRRIHYETTGPELWRQTAGAITHFVAGAGTGGTISGAGRYLKERNPRIEVICADPVGSIYSSEPPHAYMTEGVGEDFFPANYDAGVVDVLEKVTDDEAFATCHRLVRARGLLTGGSGGMVVVAALRVARRAAPGDVIVALVPDSGRAYLSKVYSQDWLVGNGFAASREAGLAVGSALERAGIATDEVRAVPREARFAEAIDLLRQTALPCLPVATTARPTSVGELVGAISVQRCWELLRAGGASAEERVHGVMQAPLPVVGGGQQLDSALTSVGEARCFVVADRGRPTAVVELADLLKRSLGSLAFAEASP